MADTQVSAHRPERLPRAEAEICLSVDVEEWYEAPGRGLGEGGGNRPAGRLAASMPLVFDLLDDLGARATLFFLGTAARDHPDLVREAVRRGHEVACHGWSHTLVSAMEPVRFEEDLRRARVLLQDLSGQAVIGFRAPRWSLDGAPWAYGALERAGFTYSSSRLPIPGLGGGRRGPHSRGSVLEIPALVFPGKSMPVPAGGTLALRWLPTAWLRAARDDCLAQGRPAVYWFHPWEVDPESPRIRGAGGPFTLQRYAFLSRLPGRLSSLAGGGAVPLAEAALRWRT